MAAITVFGRETVTRLAPAAQRFSCANYKVSAIGRKPGEPDSTKTGRIGGGAENPTELNGSEMEKKTSLEKSQGRFKNPAIPTFALVYTIIGSESLTTVFGMGTGDPF